MIEKQKQKQILSKEDEALLKENAEQEMEPPFATDIMPDDPHSGHSSNNAELLIDLEESVSTEEE